MHAHVKLREIHIMLVPIVLQTWFEQIDDLVQYCSNSIANALELLQFCTKPSKCV